MRSNADRDVFSAAAAGPADPRSAEELPGGGASATQLHPGRLQTGRRSQLVHQRGEGRHGSCWQVTGTLSSGPALEAGLQDV